MANPTGGTVAQGTASFSTSGSQLTVRTSDRAYINWQSFNIGIGETTTFMQPSASSLVWNNIHDSNPSQILGNLNANGYVILQNQNGFFIGGQAMINAHGLLLTTAPIPMPDLSSGGAWDFSAPPPTASIINYGAIHLDQGGSVFLIAHDIENHGTISAPDGNIGLHAGDQVLVSERPDGRGLSAEVTLPSGSVDNSGRIIADGGTIAMHAQVVNQGGLVQANSVREVNGTIELVASGAVNLGNHSVLSAHGDAQGVSSGGSVLVKSAGQFTDQAGSTINIAGGAQGGNGGQVEISAADLNAPQSSIEGHALEGFLGGKLTIDPLDLTLDLAYISSLNSQISGGLSQIDLQADNNITLAAPWTLAAQGSAAAVNLTAGNSIILNNGSYINAGNNWSVNLTAGPLDLAVKPTTARTDGIYLDGSAYIQTANGDINIWAANELLINTIAASSSANGIRTVGGGNITATAKLGDMNTGGNSQGFSQFKATAPAYPVSTSLGGISTAAGGNVTITAGGNVTSLLPTSGSSDAGSGAFGPSPGNVSITAGGSVFGHYVLANGIGTINAAQDIGNASGGDVALSLIKGSWDLNAGGNISLQEVRNPNGVFNAASGGFGGSSTFRHLFDYEPHASVSLTAGNAVYLTGLNIPRPSGGVSIIYPPSLDISAGAGGIVLEKTISLFPSLYQNLNLSTIAGGSLIAQQSAGSTTTELIMSDSDQTHWIDPNTFGDGDHGATIFGMDDPNPVTLDIAGNIENLVLFTTKATHITVGGDLINSSFSGQNLHNGDVTSIDVAGQIYNRSSYSFAYLNQGIAVLPTTDLPPGAGYSWETIFSLALNSSLIANLQVPTGLLPGQWATYVVQNALLFPGGNPGFVYNPTTRRLGFSGDMSTKLSSSQVAALESGAGLTVLVYDPATGLPVTHTGADGKQYFQTTTVSWADPAAIASLYTASLRAPSPNNSTQFGYRVGGPGEFDVHAGSISLGNSLGILSCGVGQPPGGNALYSKLAPFTPSGASLNVTVDGDLNMLSSTIATLGGGNLNVNVGGSMDLGSPELSGSRGGTAALAYGIFTTGRGNVSVTAGGDISIDGSRIAAFNGGNVSVVSQTGNVDAGAGGAVQANLYYFYVDPDTGQATTLLGGVYGSGILATTLPVTPRDPVVPGSASQPGDITVATPRGDILASQGGILQEALNGNVAPGPTITLSAGTPSSDGNPGYTGDINLGNSGVIGGTVNLQANGNITGLVISRQDSTVNAAHNFSGTVVSGGTANLSAGGNVSGTVFGVGGVNASGNVSGATLLGQNVSANGGAAQSTLGTTATASAASQSASAQTSNDTKEQVASNNTDDEDQKKKKKKHPLLRRVGRVTVILPKTS